MILPRSARGYSGPAAPKYPLGKLDGSFERRWSGHVELDFGHPGFRHELLAVWKLEHVPPRAHVEFPLEGGRLTKGDAAELPSSRASIPAL